MRFSKCHFFLFVLFIFFIFFFLFLPFSLVHTKNMDCCWLFELLWLLSYCSVNFFRFFPLPKHTQDIHVLSKWIHTDNPVEKSVSERSSVETVVRFSSTYGFRNKITKTKTVFVFLSNGRLINRCSNEFKNIGSSIQINLFLFIFVLLLFWCHYYLFGNEFGQEKGLYSLHFVNRFKFSGQFRSKF